MRNLILKAFVLLSFITLVSISCSDSCDENQATKDSERITELSSIYIADILNEEKCLDFVNAVKQFVSNYRDCDDVDQASLDTIEQSISALPYG